MRCGALKLTSHNNKRFGATPEYRAVELGPWLAKIGRPGFLDKLRKTASIYDRIARVFAVTDGAHCETLDAAFCQAGLRVVQANAEPNIAVDGALMDVPLAEHQLNEAKMAWLALRAFVGNVGSKEQEDALAHALGPRPPNWIKALHLLNQDFPDAAQKGVSVFERNVEDATRPAQILRAVLAARAGNVGFAQDILNDTPPSWRDGKDYQNALSLVRSFQKPSAERPWVRQARPALEQ